MTTSTPLLEPGTLPATGSPGTTTTPRPVVTDPGGHELMTHVVMKNALTDAVIFGQEVTALCGKRWVPSRDPKKYPLCGTCKQLIEAVHKDWSESDNEDGSNQP